MQRDTPPGARPLSAWQRAPRFFSPCLPARRASLLFALHLACSAWSFPVLAEAPAPLDTAAPTEEPPAPTPSAPPVAPTATPLEVEPPGYAQAIDAAVREHELGHFQEARELLRRAHGLFPNARTLRGLGKVEYELRNYGDAVQYLEQALVSPVKPLDARLRADVEQVLGRARAYVGEVHVNVDPGSASVIVDGITVASGPQASFSLLVGDHVIEFRADGRMSERRSVRVKGGEQTNIQVVLSPPLDLTPRNVARQASSSAPAPGAPPKDRPVYKNPWLWTGLAIVAAGAATAVAVLATRDQETVAAPHSNSSDVFLGGQ
jgi:hypothetical protein